MLASDTSDLLESIALLTMAVSGGIFLMVALWKGRTFVAKYKQLEVTLNPERLEKFSTKMDEVVQSVNNKAPDEPSLFQRVKVIEQNQSTFQKDIKRVDSKVSSVSANMIGLNRRFDLLIQELRTQVGVSINEQKEESINEESRT